MIRVPVLNANNFSLAKDHGYALLIVMVLLGAIGLVVAVVGERQNESNKIMNAMQVSFDSNREAEAGVGYALAWLRTESQKLVTPFRRENFYANFDRTAYGSGDNDSGDLAVKTLVKLDSTNNSAIIPSDVSIGPASFPSTVDITNNTAFSPTTEFASAMSGLPKVRITLVDAIAEVPANDYGAPPAAEPDTDFSPLFRIDALGGDSDEILAYAVVKATGVHLFGLGVYGETFLTTGQTCNSYDSGAGVYSTGIRTANCTVATNGTLTINSGTTVYGEASTNGTISNSGSICADFGAGCPNAGGSCGSADCGVSLLEPPAATWTTYCPSDQGSVNISGTSTLTVSSSDPADSCWDTITIEASSTLTIETDGLPYYFRTIDFVDSATSKLTVTPNPSSGIVTLYVEQIITNSFSGVQIENGSDVPNQFKFIYLGNTALTVSGATDLEMAFAAPQASVATSGSFALSGAIVAKDLTLGGTGEVHYDETLGLAGPLIDLRLGLGRIMEGRGL